MKTLPAAAPEPTGGRHAGARAAPGLEYVGFWLRVLATLIDSVLLVIVTLPLTFAVYGRLWAPAGQGLQGSIDLLINWLLPAVLILWLWRRLQATPGKLALSARIVDARTGAAPTLYQLVIRYIGYFVSAIPLGLGLLWVAFDRRKQGWHDKLANTVVVRPSRRGAASFAPAAGATPAPLQDGD